MIRVLVLVVVKKRKAKRHVNKREHSSKYYSIYMSFILISCSMYNVVSYGHSKSLTFYVL